MKILAIKPEYVEFIPKALEDGILYISKKYGTASHNCCCGCGTKIVTPLRNTEFSLSDRNGLVSLNHSIGNWNHPCQSHYWIKNNRVIWTGKMTKREIERGRTLDDAMKSEYFSNDDLLGWHRKVGATLHWIKSIFGLQ